jgi:Ca2+-binding EF-hand superfamily protein
MQRTKSVLLSGLVTASMLAAVTVHAQTSAPVSEPPASTSMPAAPEAKAARGSRDTDGDRRISREEAKNHPRLAKNFDTLDTNKDGYLSREEMKAARGTLDADGDGRISREDAKSRPHLAKNFDALDTNKDGYLSSDEMKAAKAHGEKRQLTAIDTDRDGRISREEAKARPNLADNFDRLDTDKDGFLSQEELAAARQAMARK